MLAAVARHVNPVLRNRGWRVKRLIESTSRTWIGCCTSNGRNDADAASVNIQLNLRRRPFRSCQQFFTFRHVLAVMLHEIAHTSVGLEDIHPPAFWELLDEIKAEYRSALRSGEVALETDPYGCHETVVVRGTPQRIVDAAQQVDRDQRLGLAGALRPPSVGESQDGSTATEPLTAFEDAEIQNCGSSNRRYRRQRKRQRDVPRPNPPGDRAQVRQTAPKTSKKAPLLRGAKMLDGRTRDGKRAKQIKENVAPRVLAAQAALQRLGQRADLECAVTAEAAGASDAKNASTAREMGDADVSRSQSDLYRGDEIDYSSDEESIEPHAACCSCRSCLWEAMLCLPASAELSGS
jgi:hypothetical protein